MKNIKFPKRDYIHKTGAYGETKLIEEYCGVIGKGYQINGEWQHGWLFPENNIHPELVVGSTGKSYEKRKKNIFYVARQDQVDYLKSEGYRKVYAIGLPIIYVEPERVEKIRNSLLVMPAHSVSDSSENWNENAIVYLEYIKKIANNFSTIHVCVHESCYGKGNWVREFENYGFNIIKGADKNDANSLIRMASIFNQFEFVTSNSFGSHIPYAAYFNCKVSVAGPELDWKREYCSTSVFYKNCPELIDIKEDWHKNRLLQKSYSQFLVEPSEAKKHKEWAAWQLGVQCKNTPKELRKMFRWDLSGKTLLASKKYLRLLYHAVKRLLA